MIRSSSRSVLFAGLTLFAAQARALDYISLDFSGEMTDLERQTFVDAAAYWNSAITGFRGTYAYQDDGVTMDTGPRTLTITATISAIDGVGGVLGSSGPQTLRYADDNPTGAPTYARYYSKTGSMNFDSADAASLVSSNSFYGVVLHEMGHVLGLGTLWDLNTASGVGNPIYNASAASVTYNGQTVGAYTGQYALAKWISEFGQAGATFVPVEKGGGSGTTDGHWNEFDGGGIGLGPVSDKTGLDVSDELMTGWASDTFFVSDMTLGSLEDLGYDVDYSKSGVVDHVVVVPEPAVWSPLAAGVVFALAARRRAKARKATVFP